MTIIKKIPRNKSPEPVRENSVGPHGLTCSKHPWRVAAMRWQLLLYIILLLYILDVGQAYPFQRNEPTKTKVCSGELDIRNDVSNFEKYLRNCTVIEGSLSILLIEYSGVQDYDTLHFPELVEITDYLLLYRVYGLRTLRHIFPNLAVIGGQLLFYDYALVVFEMQDMDELGLRGLTQIRRGAVRIEKNPELCYINTIDWSVLAKNITMEDHIFSGNREKDDCVNFCPKDEKGRDTCPMVIQDQGQATPVCWSSYDCQIRATDCPNNARNIFDNKTCCHEECLGGCTGPGSEHCLACKNVLKDNRCLKRCDPHTYKFRGWRCISARECEEMKAEGKDNWKLFKNQCLKECPHGYRDSEENRHRCVQCKGRCPKVCKGDSIDSVSFAQSLAGCTIINGHLLIHIQGGAQVSKVLEQYLGSVEEVYDYVSIVRSNQLASLHFLKNLRVIHGNHLYDSKYSLVLLDNQNLEEIWDFDTHPNLTIKRGNMSIHQNPRLCMNKIQELRRRTGFTEKINPTEIGTNGDKATCEHQEIKLQVYNTQKNVVFVNFTNIKLSDERELLGYVARYKEAPERNLTKRGAHNLCDSDGWMSLDVQSDTNQTFVLFIIYDLKSWTQYGVYLETYTLSSAVLGGESKITYFRTNPDVPTNPQDVKVSVKQAGELTVSWKPPREPNGNVTHYYVYWLPKKLKTEEYERRNYCLFKLHLANKGEKPEIDKEDKPQNRTGPCCSCPKSEKQLELEQAERMFMIRFENFLHNTVYKKRPVSLNREEDKKEERRKRSTGIINETDHQGFHDLMNQTGTTYNISQMPHEQNMTHEPEDVVPYHAAVVYYKTEIVLSDLHHFQEYSIEVIACHEYAEGTDERLCSNRAITTARTLKKDDADTIDHTNVTVKEDIDPEDQEVQVTIKWPEPPAPNGIIITYEIEFQHMQKAAEEIRPTQLCITHRKYLEIHGWVLPKLNPGNYSFKLRATSLAGNGSWTPDLYFFVQDTNNGRIGIGNEIVAGIAASAALVIVFLVALGVWFIAKKRFNQGTPNGILYASVNPEYISVGKWDTYVPDEWEVPRDKICLLRELGQGSFGMVYEGIAKNLWPDKSEEVRVAVKTVNEGASLRDRIEFLNEASVMKAFNCNHVVKLLGVVSQGQPTLVIMELMASGDLKNFLRQHRPDEEDNNGREALTLRQILQMAGEIADGMAYLASKKYVHRDLAARNCMVAESLTVKIGDFGMTRDIYERDYYRKGGKGLLPVRWMAPESLKDGVFTSLSDVWSYGVVLWEMATLAAQPYQGLSNEQVLKFVIDGGLMEKPEGCPDKLFMLMQKCWQYTAKRRPTFHEIIEILVPDLEEDFKEKSYFFSPENQSEMSSEKQAAAAAVDTNQEGTIDLDDEEDYIEKPDVHTPLTGSPKNGVYVRNADAALLSEAASSSRHNTQPGASPDAVTVEIMPEHEKLYRQVSSDSNATPTAPPSEGSKGSSKSSSSGYSHMNGLANGHLPIHVPNSMQC